MTELPRQDLLAASSEAVAKRDFRFDAGDHDMRGHGIQMCCAANALGYLWVMYPTAKESREYSDTLQIQTNIEFVLVYYHK